MKERVLYYNHPYKLQFTSCKKKVIKMDMYQKRKIRAEKKKDDSPKSFPSVGSNWLTCIYDDYYLNRYKMGAFKE